MTLAFGPEGRMPTEQGTGIHAPSEKDMASAQVSKPVDGGNYQDILRMLDQLRQAVEVNQALPPEHRAYVVAYAYPRGLKAEEVTGKNHETELTEEFLAALVPKMIGKPFTTSHGKFDQSGKARSFVEKPIEIGTIKDARLDETGAVVTLIELDTTPNALWTGQLIHEGKKPEVSFFYWIGQHGSDPGKLEVNLDHVCSTTKGYHDGTQVVGYFQYAANPGDQKYRIFDSTLSRIGTTAMSTILNAIQSSRCYDALEPFSRAWRDNGAPGPEWRTPPPMSSDPTKDIVDTPASPPPDTEAVDPTPTEEGMDVAQEVASPADPVVDTPKSTEEPVATSEPEQSGVNTREIFENLERLFTQLRESMLSDKPEVPSEDQASSDPVSTSSEEDTMAVEPVEPEKQETEGTNEIQPSEPTADLVAITKTKPPVLPTVSKQEARASPAIPLPQTQSVLEGSSFRPVGNSANFPRDMSAAAPASSTSQAPVVAAQPEATTETPAVSDPDYVGDRPTTQGYTPDQLLELAATNGDIDKTKLMAAFVNLMAETDTLKGELSKSKSREEAERNEMLDSLKAMLSNHFPEQKGNIDNVVSEARANPDSPSFQLVHAMAASLSEQARPESSESAAIQELARSALLRKTGAQNARYQPYPTSTSRTAAQAVANSQFARNNLNTKPSFSIGGGSRPSAASTPHVQLTQRQVQVGLMHMDYDAERA